MDLTQPIAREPIVPSEAERAWAEAISFTREKSPASFDQWFSGVQFDGLTDGVLSLRARDEFVRQWVEDYFLPTLTDQLRDHTGLSIQVRWAIDGALEHPVADRPAPFAPVRPRPLSVRPPAPFGADDAPRDADSGIHQILPESGRPVAVAAPVEGLNSKYTFANFVVGPSQPARARRVHGGRRRRWAAPQPALHLRGHGSRQDAPRPRRRVPRPRGAAGRAHRLHQRRALRERVRRRPCKTRRCTTSARATARSATSSWSTTSTSSRVRRRRRKSSSTRSTPSTRPSKQIVVTSDKYPQQLDKMEERLVSRFQWGLVADIQAPELETRVAIVRKKAQIEHIDLADEVCLFIAQMVRSNVRELEGTLIRLAAKASLLGKAIDIEFARTEIAATTTARPNEASVEDIQRIVCHHFKLRSTDLLSKDRHKSIAFARHVAMYLCKQRLKCSFPELGRAFGNRDHTTVISAVRKVEALRSSDPEVRAHIEAIERKLGAVE